MGKKSVSNAASENTGRHDEWTSDLSVEEYTLSDVFCPPPPLPHLDGWDVQLLHSQRPFTAADWQHGGANTLGPLDKPI